MSKNPSHILSHGCHSSGCYLGIFSSFDESEDSQFLVTRDYIGVSQIVVSFFVVSSILSLQTSSFVTLL